MNLRNIVLNKTSQTKKKKKPTKISLKCTSLRRENLPWARMGMRTDMQIGKSELLGVTEIFQNVFWWWVNSCINLPKISELYS